MMRKEKVKIQCIPSSVVYLQLYSCLNYQTGFVRISLAVLLTHLHFRAELEQKGRPCIIRASLHVLLANFQVFLALNFQKLSYSCYLLRPSKSSLITVKSLSISTMPFFICSSSTEARYFAAIVPLVNCIRLVTYGLRIFTDEGLIKSVTREGKPE